MHSAPTAQRAQHAHSTSDPYLQTATVQDASCLWPVWVSLVKNLGVAIQQVGLPPAHSPGATLTQLQIFIRVRLTDE